ncbi:NADH-dependent flavin oxidoreductase [Enterococcus nangangensis]|uniref:NADH-dependent flavin oxidoreductase n=1 Tax=Enterococcus nangangensis TaxID=2559926 RepID=UPI0010F59628|nr:NADH-dependent flavin oxidoreductase [Enterococcus nangangensis]
MVKAAESFTFQSGVTVANRTLMAPMTTKMSFYNGVVTQDECGYYHQRAGEVGAIVTGAANVQADGKCWEGELSVESDALIPSLSQLASAIHVGQTKAILQIFHGGRRTTKAILRGTQPVSASAVAAVIPGSEVPRPLTAAEILTTIQNFKEATRRAILAGFDGVEIHGANTYLLQQFFSPHSNRREDEWGGSLANRFRFIEAVVDGVLATVQALKPQNFLVGYRFSPEELETPGISFADTLFLVDHLADKKLDYLHVSLNDYQKVSQSEAYQERTILSYLHEKIAGRLPLIGVGNIWSSQDVAEVLTDAEFAAIGTGLLFDPHFVRKVLTQNDEAIATTLQEGNRDILRISDGAWGFLTGRSAEKLELLQK